MLKMPIAVALAAALLVISACMKPVSVGGGQGAVQTVEGFQVLGGSKFNKVFKPATLACAQQEIRLNYSNAAEAAAQQAWQDWAKRGAAQNGRFSFEDVIIESHCHSLSVGSFYCGSHVELVAEIESSEAETPRQQVVLQSSGKASGDSCDMMTSAALDKALKSALSQMVEGFAGPTVGIQSSMR